MGYEIGAKSDIPLEGGKSAEALYEEVGQLMDNESKGAAIGGLKMLLVMYPDYALAHNDLRVLYYNEGDKEKALHHYDQAARLEPENLVFQKNLADLYCLEAGRWEDALKIYLNILEKNPTDIEMLTTLGDICVSLEKGNDVRTFYERVLELEPWNMDVNGKLEALEKGEMPEDGWRRTDGGGSRSEDNGQESKDDAYESAQVLIADGRHKEGIEALEQLIERSPNYAVAHNDLGVMHFNEGEKQKALEHYERAIALDPENVTFPVNVSGFTSLT